MLQRVWELRQDRRRSLEEWSHKIVEMLPNRLKNETNSLFWDKYVIFTTLNVATAQEAELLRWSVWRYPSQKLTKMNCFRTVKNPRCNNCSIVVQEAQWRTSFFLYPCIMNKRIMSTYVPWWLVIYFLADHQRVCSGWRVRITTKTKIFGVVIVWN